MLPTQDEQEVLQVENRRYEAMIKGDLAALDAILSAECTYSHSNGVLDTKAQYMATLASGQLRYISITPQEAQIRCYGACSVVTGIALLHLQLHRQDRRFRIRYTNVYIKQQHRWQMVVFHSTGLPDA